jgi:hypothetical protein
MLSDEEFAEVELRATICTGQCEWPKPEDGYSRMLHQSANEARERVRRAVAAIDEIDSNATISRDDKYHQRSEIAAQAIANFEASKTLTRTREAVSGFIELWKRDDQRVSNQIAEAALKALKEVERDWPRAMNKIAERAGRTTAPNMRR